MTSDNVRNRTLEFTDPVRIKRVSKHPVFGTIHPADMVVPGIVGSQETISRTNHGWLAYQRLLADHWDNLPDGLKNSVANQDYGWSFQTRRHEYKGSESIRNYQGSQIDGWTHYYNGARLHAAGAVASSRTHSLWPVLSPQDTNVLVVAGTKAIKQTMPAGPSADVLVALGELYRDGLPGVPGKRVVESHRRRFQSIGDEYLNIEFGWKPLLRDLQDVADTVQNQDKILENYFRYAGHRLKRRWNFPDVITTTTYPDVSGVYPYPTFSSGVYTSSGVRSRVRVQKTRMWFSGCYTYYVPTPEEVLGRWRMYEHAAYRLYGVRIDPNTLWNLTPWSWLVDWGLNVGDIMSNLSQLAFQDVVIRYGYIMCETRIDDTYTLRGNFGNGIPSVLSETYSTVTKQRLRASPFGFGITFSGFSPKQLAILAALGISRS